MFNIILTNGIEDTELTFKVRETTIAQKWFDELSKNYPIFENDRFTNWSHDNNLVNDLNEQIRIINSYEKIIDYTVSDKTTQKELNYLHKFFEDLRGEVTVGTEWFNNAPMYVKSATERLNILIHQLEEYIRDKNHPTLVVTFHDRPRFELTEDDMKHFTFKWEKGSVYINYCHVGKPVLDVYKDHDDLAEGIRPQTHYSADFLVKFGPSTNPFYYQMRKIAIYSWLKLQKFNFKNPNIGYIPVADLVGDFDIENYRKFNKVKKVECIK